jgi:hypothetical protein
MELFDDGLTRTNTDKEKGNKQSHRLREYRKETRKNRDSQP